MMTRKTRGLLKNTAQNDFINLKQELLNNEVIDLAVDLHGILAVISSKYSPDAIVDLVPELISLLNRLDASLKVVSDMQSSLNSLADENQILRKSLADEKLKRKIDMEESLNFEDSAEQEIKALKDNIAECLQREELLKKELEDKNAIITILKNDCDNLSSKLAKTDLLTPSVESAKNVINSDFRYPRKPLRNIQEIPDSAIPLSNRFNVLSNETSPKITAGQKICTVAQVHRAETAPTPKKSRPALRERRPPPPPPFSRKPRVTVLTDSQGKDLHSHLNTLCKDFDVFVLSKPGAKLKHIVESGEPLIKDFSKNDAVVLLAGSNDISHKDPGTLTIIQALEAVFSWKVDCNVLLHSIPYRYDDPSLNNDIYYTNLTIARMVKEYHGEMTLCCGDVNAVLKRKHFTNHGLHYNKFGKRLLARTLSSKLTQLLSSNESNGPTAIEDCCDVTSLQPISDCLPSSADQDISAIEPYPNSQNSSVSMSSSLVISDSPQETIMPQSLSVQQESYNSASSNTQEASSDVVTELFDEPPQRPRPDVQTAVRLSDSPKPPPAHSSFSPKAPEITMDNFPPLKKTIHSDSSFLDLFNQTGFDLTPSTNAMAPSQLSP
jgi:hypothetical protein